MTNIIRIVLFAWLFATAGAWALPQLEAGEAGSYNLVPYLAWFEDETGQLQLADVLRQPQRFRPVAGSGPRPTSA